MKREVTLPCSASGEQLVDVAHNVHWPTLECSAEGLLEEGLDSTAVGEEDGQLGLHAGNLLVDLVALALDLRSAGEDARGGVLLLSNAARQALHVALRCLNLQQLAEVLIVEQRKRSLHHLQELGQRSERLPAHHRRRVLQLVHHQEVLLRLHLDDPLLQKEAELHEVVREGLPGLAGGQDGVQLVLVVHGFGSLHFCPNVVYADPPVDLCRCGVRSLVNGYVPNDLRGSGVLSVSGKGGVFHGNVPVDLRSRALSLARTLHGEVAEVKVDLRRHLCALCAACRLLLFRLLPLRLLRRFQRQQLADVLPLHTPAADVQLFVAVLVHILQHLAHREVRQVLIRPRH
mmetsp:Transcript_2604/g.9250  ORF Transcript_2604/g.9250 Transcript_2604/m.9250 type:complete len:345 (+) Transcript_2604:1495-2529(+)